MVEILLKNGADPNIPCNVDKGKNTPLHLAVSFKFKKIIDLLISHNADEGIPNCHGKLPWEGII